MVLGKLFVLWMLFLPVVGDHSPTVHDSPHILMIVKAPRDVDHVKLLNAFEDPKVVKALPAKGLVSVARSSTGFFAVVAPVWHIDGEWQARTSRSTIIELDLNYKLLFIGYPL